jgi:type I restriction enzyme S subunit
VAQQHFNVGAAKALKFRLPDLFIQRRIGEIIKAYCDLIELNTRRITILEEMVRRLFDEWFVRFRFPGHNGEECHATTIGVVPKAWPVKSAAEIIEFDPRTSVPKDGEKPFVPMTAISTNSMVIGDVENRAGNSGSKFQNGDTLLARITPCLENGKTGFVDFLRDGEVAFGSTEFIVMRGRTVPPEWVYLFSRGELFRGNAIKSMSGATGRQRVRQASLENFAVAEPDRKTLESFTTLVRPMFKQVHILARANRLLRAARDLLLPKLISGEIDLSVAARKLEAAQ